jgi:hypothetical protein
VTVSRSLERVRASHLLHNQCQFRGVRQRGRAGSEIARDINGVGSGLRICPATAARRTSTTGGQRHPQSDERCKRSRSNPHKALLSPPEQGRYYHQQEQSRQCQSHRRLRLRG